MRDHRQGNDLKVIWSILNNGKPFSLSGKELKLYLKNMYERKEVEDFTARGNQIHWTFYGKDQKQTGKYSLILVGNEGEVGMITIDTCDFVNIVSCSCKVKNSEDLPNVETETIELTSNLDYVAGTGGGGEGGGSYDDAALWKELAKKVDKEEGKGLSSNDFTNALKEKLEGLENYDDAEISSAVEKLSRDFNALLGDNASAAIESFNEIIAFLEGIEDSARLDAIVASIQHEIAKVSTNTDAKLAELSTQVGGLSERVDELEQGGQGGADVFKAEYGKTTIEEVTEAYNAGKVVHCDYQNICYVLSSFASGQAFFNCLNANNATRLELKTDSRWAGPSAYKFETDSNKVKTISEASTDTQYPSAKAVYDALQNVGGGEPSQYIKDATTSADGNTLTLTKKDGSTVSFSPSGGGGGSTTDLTAVAKWGVLTQTLKQVGNATDGYTVQVSNPVYGWIPQSFIDEVTGFGGLLSGQSAINKPTFNESTRYFEYRGITNLAYDEVRAGYMVGRNFFSCAMGYLAGNGIQYNGNIVTPYANKIRCIIHHPFQQGQMYAFKGCFRYKGNFLEQGFYNDSANSITICAGDGIDSLYAANKCLKTAGYFNFSYVKTGTSAQPFLQCYSLEEVWIKSLAISMSLAESPLLKAECVLYLISNSGATSQITITLHSTALARAEAEYLADSTQDLVAYPTLSDWALSKKIQLATA